MLTENNRTVVVLGFLGAGISVQRERDTIALGSINLKMRKYVTQKALAFLSCYFLDSHFIGTYSYGSCAHS